jgi:hypothetical protein
MAWRQRNEAIVLCRVGVVSQGATVGELLLLVSLVASRNWTLKLLRRGDEVVRWDLTEPPVRHSNPPGRPVGFPAKVTALEHEHRWLPDFGLRCARPLDLPPEAAGNHAQALAAFCERANILFETSYEAPPAAGEQLQLG